MRPIKATAVALLVILWTASTAGLFAQGQLDQRVAVGGALELESLAQSLNEMGRQLHTPIYYQPDYELEVACLNQLQQIMRTRGDVLVLMPPLCISAPETEILLQVVRESILEAVDK